MFASVLLLRNHWKVWQRKASLCLDLLSVCLPMTCDQRDLVQACTRFVVSPRKERRGSAEEQLCEEAFVKELLITRHPRHTCPFLGSPRTHSDLTISNTRKTSERGVGERASNASSSDMRFPALTSIGPFSFFFCTRSKPVSDTAETASRDAFATKIHMRGRCG